MTNQADDNNGKRVRGAQRTTREDWVKTALDTLICEGIASVKVSVLSAKLKCARSSFYWYFKDRRDLLDVLLDHWQNQNTQAIVSRANLAADTINLALVNVFSCWVSPPGTKARAFDTRLDFAVREWSRRDGSVRRAVDISDDARIGAIQGMFERYGYATSEANIRARIVYFTQIGYEALDKRESNLDRAKTGSDYLFCHTGQRPTENEVRAIIAQTGHSLEDTQK